MDLVIAIFFSSLQRNRVTNILDRVFRKRPIYRLVHLDNLTVYLSRRGAHAPNYTPNDGLQYKTIHDTDVQDTRRRTTIPCGPRGVAHDYVPFYFGYLSPMLLRLKTGQVEGYTEGQRPLIYIVSSPQRVLESDTRFVFSDGHGLAVFTNWYSDLGDLDKVDWNMVRERYWADNVDDMDRQRRKQAEFLIHRFCDWDLIDEISVINGAMKEQVEDIMSEFPSNLHRPVNVRATWYY
jgi:hypothetical protein